MTAAGDLLTGCFLHSAGKPTNKVNGSLLIRDHSRPLELVVLFRPLILLSMDSTIWNVMSFSLRISRLHMNSFPSAQEAGDSEASLYFKLCMYIYYNPLKNYGDCSGAQLDSQFLGRNDRQMRHLRSFSSTWIQGQPGCMWCCSKWHNNSDQTNQTIWF